MERLLSLVGLAVIMGIAWLLSTDRKAIRVKTVVWGLLLQLAFALFVLKTTTGQTLFAWVGDKITFDRAKVAIFEEICAPSEESHFNDRIRDAAIGKSKP